MIAPRALPTLWRIAHDQTEIPAGQFLEELAALPLDREGQGIVMTQQTLSNYVRRGWVERRRVATAPGGRGQTGYFERRALIQVLHAQRHVLPHERNEEYMGLVAAQAAEPQDVSARTLGRLWWLILTDWGYDVALQAPDRDPSWQSSEHHEFEWAHMERANAIGLLSRLLQEVPTSPDELVAFAPDVRGREAIERLRSLLELATSQPVETMSARQERQAANEWLIDDLLKQWFASSPGNVPA